MYCFRFGNKITFRAALSCASLTPLNTLNVIMMLNSGSIGYFNCMIQLYNGFISLLVSEYDLEARWVLKKDRDCVHYIWLFYALQVFSHVLNSNWSSKCLITMLFKLYDENSESENCKWWKTGLQMRGKPNTVHKKVELQGSEWRENVIMHQ